MYSIFLFTHSWLRWVVIVLMLSTLFLSFRNWVLKKPFTPHIRQLFHIYRLSFGIQVLLGLLLYFVVSPLTTTFLYHDLRQIARRPQIVFTLMHPVGMVIAFLICKGGEAWAILTTEAAAKYRIWFGCTILVVVIIILTVPWPWYDGGRPLFRLMGR